MSLNKTLLLTFLSGAVNYGLLITPSYSQDLIKLPKEAQNNLTPRTLEPAPATFSPENPPPTLESSGSSQQFELYRLDTGDGVSITVPTFPEFNAVVTLDEQGEVIIPILGRVTLAGLTISEVEAKIAYELGQRFLQEQPEVLAILTLSRPAQITILGEVVRPGFYGFQAGAPLNVALQSAGGTTQEADLRSVKVRRTLVDGTVIEQDVDLYSPLLTGQEIPGIFLQGGDTIIVSRLKVGEDRTYDRSLVANSTLPQPTITVRILAPVSGRGGGGTTFGSIVLPNGSTFIEAISALPTFDNLLIKQEIALLRFDPETGKVVSQKLDAEDLIRDGDFTQNILLQDEDVIIVSRNLLGQVINAFDQITQPIRSVFGFRNFFENIFN